MHRLPRAFAAAAFFDFSAITFLFLILANCARDESCREKLAQISPKGPKFVVKADVVVH